MQLCHIDSQSVKQLNIKVLPPKCVAMSAPCCTGSVLCFILLLVTHQHVQAPTTAANPNYMHMETLMISLRLFFNIHGSQNAHLFQSLWSQLHKSFLYIFTYERNGPRWLHLWVAVSGMLEMVYELGCKIHFHTMLMCEQVLITEHMQSKF